jgi:exopolysaccharide biosynthesis polyprenyl glycosylphosphotransferase
MTAVSWRSRGRPTGPPGSLGSHRRNPQAQTPGWGRPNNGLRHRAMALDALCLVTAWAIALSAAMQAEHLGGGVPKLILETAGLTLLGLLLLFALRLYRTRVITVRSVTVERQAIVAGLLGATAWAIERLHTPHPMISMPVMGAVLTFALLATTRPCFDAWVTLLRRTGSLNRPVVLIGSAAEIADLAELLISHPEIGYRGVGYLSDGPSTESRLVDMPWLGPIASATEAVQRERATGAVIAANGLSSVELNALVRELHDAGIHVHLSSGLSRIDHRRVRQLPMAHEPFFYLEPAAPRRAELAIKRAIDLIGASTILILTSPVVLVSAILIKLSDGGPVLFRQVRVGQSGQPITIRKLRTMTVDAENKVDSLRSRNSRTGPLFKVDNDPRVTRVGWWLRASSIDELPQLLNVFDGTLSLVGPRPALPMEVAQFDEELLERQRMKPGLTGLWQVEARHNASFYAYRHLDLFYVDNWSLGLDLAILVATARTLIGDGLEALGRSRLTRRGRSRRPAEARASSVRHPGPLAPMSHPGSPATVDALSDAAMSRASGTDG